MTHKYETIFNENEKRFEVSKIYEKTETDPAFKALLLTVTIDEVKKLLEQHVINTLEALGA